MHPADIKRIHVIRALAGKPGGCESLTVADLMTTMPACVSAATTALELVRMFHAKNFRHLLVTDRAGRLEGVISDRDVLRCFGPDRRPTKKALAAIFAQDLMSTDLVTIGPAATLVQAVRIVLAQGIGCLPVLAGQSLVGILTNTDLHVLLEVLLAFGGGAIEVPAALATRGDQTLAV